jgi:organic radical activating enzyme
MKVRVSEIFSSFQGEGRFTGKPSLWIRLFGCNLSCDGFGQPDPMNPGTYILPYKTIDLTNIKQMKDLPVFPYGCDSSYSWNQRFKRLAKFLTTEEIVEELFTLGKNELGVDLQSKDGARGWVHPLTNVKSQLCFTGGEPMLNQKAINEICEILADRDSAPPQVTIETNATKPIKELNIKLLTHHLHLSCSPKLYAVSGEQNVIDFDVIAGYIDEADSGCIKFVHNGSPQAWNELEWATRELQSLIQGLAWDIWVMPVGATLEEQNPSFVSSIATEALKRGYAISMRAHIQAFGNCIGT